MRPKDNPFASHRVEKIEYSFLTGSREELVASVVIPGYRGAIVGPKGHGKTTLLEELHANLRNRGFSVRLMRLSKARRKFHAAPARAGEMILLDGAEQLRSLEWLAFLWRMRRARAVVITTHCKGRMPTLYRCETTPALLASLASSLLEDGSIVDEEYISELFERHAGDIRQALRELYDCACFSRTVRTQGKSHESFRKVIQYSAGEP